MPLYLGTLFTGDAAIIQARDREELAELVDEVGPYEPRAWAVYNGPLFVPFQLIVPPAPEDEPSEELLDTLSESGAIMAPAMCGVSASETDMLEQVSEFVFPELCAIGLRAREAASGKAVTFDPAEVRHALGVWRTRLSALYGHADGEASTAANDAD